MEFGALVCNAKIPKCEICPIRKNCKFNKSKKKIKQIKKEIINKNLNIFCYLSKKGKIALSLLIISVALTDMFCAQVLKPYFERLRPSHVNLEGLNLLVSKGGKWSMPSNHASNLVYVSSHSTDTSLIQSPTSRPMCAVAVCRVDCGVYGAPATRNNRIHIVCGRSASGMGIRAAPGAFT